MDRGRGKMDFETLTTNNDPYSLRQEVQDLNIMLDEVEQERDAAKNYAKKLESDLKKTKEILQNNQLNLIDPLQKKITELEAKLDEKEADIKKRYKWKLRKYKREIEMEKKINHKLKSKLSRDHSRHREDSSLGIVTIFHPLFLVY